MSDGIYPVGDAYRHTSRNYPYNVIPQSRSPEPEGSYPDLKCPPDDSLQSIIFDGPNLVVIKGYQWKSKFELKDFFVPCNGFFEMEILIPYLKDDVYHYHEAYHGSEDEYITLNYGLLQDNLGNVPFVALFPQYHNLTENDQDLWKLNFRFQGETEWRQLGRIFMWSATKSSGVPPIEMQNNIAEDVYLKILIAN